MPPVEYVVLRLARRWIPNALMQYLKRKQRFVCPGWETSTPSTAVNHYEEMLSLYGVGWKQAMVFILGYGGFLGVAVELLRRGASHVILYDPYAKLDNWRNATLPSLYDSYLIREGKRVLPNPQYITLLRQNLQTAVAEGNLPTVDVVLSSWVYEHIAREEIEPITRALASITAPTGIHLHFIDLRDHFFKYPFQMLTFSESTWRRWFNPPSNLNRQRLGDFRKTFAQYFDEVDIHVLERDLDNFQRTRPHIRPEFLTGDESIDSVTLFAVVARGPMVK